MKEVEQNELLQWKEKCIEFENMNEEIIKSNVVKFKDFLF